MSFLSYEFFQLMTRHGRGRSPTHASETSRKSPKAFRTAARKLRDTSTRPNTDPRLKPPEVSTIIKQLGCSLSTRWTVWLQTERWSRQRSLIRDEVEISENEKLWVLDFSFLFENMLKTFKLNIFFVLKATYRR